jgi:hypothetical protein
MNIRRILLGSFVLLIALLCSGMAEVDELVVEALIDDNSQFHVRPDTVWWENTGGSKVGQWNHQNEPTYINGVAWKPRWTEGKKDAPDKSSPYSAAFKTLDLEFELLSVSKQRGGAPEKSEEISAKVEGNHYVVRITDPGTGARWYKFVIRKKKK